MQFHSFVFLAFLVLVLGCYFALHSWRWQNALLLVASYIFYGWWDWRFLGLIAFSTLVDYLAGLALGSSESQHLRRLCLLASLSVNLGTLAFFKYFHFFADSAAVLLGAIGWQADPVSLQVILPVGISFYTFQSMSYTIDVYRRKLEPIGHLGDFALYVSFFPQLVAGPIERALHLLPQIRQRRQITGQAISTGLFLLLVGYVKKVVIADRLAPIVNLGFASEDPSWGSLAAWMYLYAFAIQIYADFSGYSDIARGISKILGFDLMINFSAPYLVGSPSAFWRHWHISLSTWLRDYLYIPLGGNRHGPWKTARNLLVTMLLGGLWHGAGWAYVFWGLFHGLLLCVWRVGERSGSAEAIAGQGATRPKTAEDDRSRPVKTPQVRSGFFGWLWFALGVVVFQHLVCIGWLFFRAGASPQTVRQEVLIGHYLACLIGSPSSGPVWPAEFVAQLGAVFGLGVLALFLQWKTTAIESFAGWPTHRKAGATFAAMSLICCLGVFEGATFIYFKF